MLKDIFCDQKVFTSKIPQIDSQVSEDGIVYLIASHTNVPINNKIYTQDEFKEQQKTITTPYNKKILLHHDRYSDAVGIAIEADYFSQQEISEAEKIVGSKIDMPEGSDGFLFVKAAIKDTKTLEKIKQGLYSNVSIGIDFNKIECNICGKDITFDYDHEHIIGSKYDEKTCYAVPRGITIQEISIVNVPADGYAKILTKENKDEKTFEINKTNVNYINESDGGVQMDNKDFEKKINEIDVMKTDFATFKANIARIEEMVGKLTASVAPAIDFVVKHNESIRNEKINKILELRTIVQLDQSDAYKEKLIKKNDDELQDIYSDLEAIRQKLNNTTKDTNVEQQQESQKEVTQEPADIKAVEQAKPENTSSDEKNKENTESTVQKDDELAKNTNIENPVVPVDDQSDTHIKGTIKTDTVLSQLGIIKK